MIAAVLALGLLLQDDVPPPQGQIDKAIKNGAEALMARMPIELEARSAPLLLFTLVHSGIPLTDEKIQGLLSRVLAEPLARTYQVALTAAALAAIDPYKYQDKLARCAQYLVDTQCENGQWSYGEPYEFPADYGTTAGGKGTVATVKIRRIKKAGPAAGDNSNSQYAALGLKYCSMGAVEVEGATLNRAIDWWERSQQKDGGWAYDHNGVPAPKIAAYGTMTAGGVGSLIMLKQLKKSDPKVASSVTRGFKWMEEHFTVEKNPDAFAGLADWRFYYLYAMERACDLFPTEKIGKKAWYAIGANYLIKIQRSDGMWVSEEPEWSMVNTCFALLFLERVARRPPVATGGKTAESPPK